ncbi:VirB4 family type IV secretion/conjugal transfer ATPase (plasmid) [Asticcacaulis sp. DW145]|uniref:VirB4 family type IV secretion/conjugal transfer ATPase n=1 Tax=Asticcacaulis sp. DW145 TaxID=3095608 RepID=UPI003086FAC3|nr:VirB4 family type IV secretion/conjugal transfer ATPase [Asticcacaulis sp. DW145]
MRSKAMLKAAAAAQISSSDFVPMGAHVADNVVKLRGCGDYVATWRLEGIAFETADPDEIHVRKEGLNNFLRSLGGGHFALWTHKVRRVVTERLDGVFGIPFCAELNAAYNASFDTHRQIRTELYLTLIYRPTPSKALRFFKGTSRSSIEEKRAQEADALAALDDAARQFEASMGRYGPKRLATRVRNDIVYSEMLSFYGYLLNGVWEETPLRRGSIDQYLPSSRLHFSDRNGMLEIWHPSVRKFAGFLDFQDYPKWSEPGMANGILYGDYEYIETQSFSILNRRDALAALERQKGQLVASEDVAEREIEEMDRAMDDLQSGVIDLGDYHYSLAVFGPTLEAVATSMSEARAVLQDGPGFKMSVIDAVPECAWFAQLPGNWSMRPRAARLTSRNFAALSPFHNFAQGKRSGNPWGEALALLKTPSGQPYYFNFHASPEGRDSSDEKYAGNTFICGSTGVGKTALEMALLAFATKYQGLRCVFFDKDRGAEIAIRAMGGQYHVLKRGERTGFNPFQMAPTEANIQFCERLVKLLVRPDGDRTSLTAREDGDISHAVRTVMGEGVSRELRSLSAVVQNLPKTGDNGLGLRLKKWMRRESLGWAFDNPEDTQDFGKAQIFAYDYTEFLDDPEIRTPIMAYLLHVTEQLIDGRPFVYVMEEFWKPLMDEHFADFALNKQKTIRKQGGMGIFTTQSPSDVLTHKIGKTMVEQTVTQIFMPNPKADHDDYVNGFKVTEAEYRIIKNLGEASRMFLVKQGHSSAVVKFDLGGMADILNVLSGTTENVEMLDGIRAEVGDDPAVWLPIFRARAAQRRQSISRGERVHAVV